MKADNIPGPLPPSRSLPSIARSAPRRSRSRTQDATSSGGSTGEPSPSCAPSSSTTDAIGRSLELLAKVRTGAMPGRMLAPADRQALVALLAADGLSSPEIAQILQVADRTIERDRRALRDANRIPKDPRLVEQMVGRLVAEAELSVQRMRRTAREREVDPAIKIDAEHRCFQVVRDLVQSLQRLGYLPTATQKVEADLTHHVGELPTLTDLQMEIDRVKQLGGGDEVVPGLIEVERVVARAALASRVKDVTATVNTMNKEAEDEAEA